MQLRGPYDVIYSSLTMLHIRDKAAATGKMAALLSPGGRAVLSLSKDREAVLDFGTRQIRVYPDDPEDIARLMQAAGLHVTDVPDTAFAWLIRATKG